MALTRIASKSELPPEGEAREFACGERMICVANVGGEISALDNICIHRGGPLGQGTIEDGKLVCPWHGWTFDPRSGEVGHNPTAKVPTYPVKIDGEDVLVDI